jgi:hypothetical protein
MRLCAVALFLCILAAPLSAADLEAFADLNLHDAAALQEASRVLAEELKLAGKPQTYVVIDLVLNFIQIKGRGIELHRIPLAHWSASSTTGMTGTFRLLARPAVVRRRVDPSATMEQKPISLADMPVHYEMSLLPSMTLEVVPAPGERPLLWSLASGRMWLRQLQSWGSAWLGTAGPSEPCLQVTVSVEQAQSFAWALVDGMPFVIRRISPQ